MAALSLLVPIAAAAAEPGFAGSPAGGTVAAADAADDWKAEAERLRRAIEMSAAREAEEEAAALARRDAAAMAAQAAGAAASMSEKRRRAATGVLSAMSANAARQARTDRPSPPEIQRLASALSVMAATAAQRGQEAGSLSAKARALREGAERAARHVDGLRHVGREAGRRRFELAMALAEAELELALALALAEASPVAHVAAADPQSWTKRGADGVETISGSSPADEPVEPAVGPAARGLAVPVAPVDELALLAPDPDPRTLAMQPLPGAAGGFPIVGPVSTRFDRSGVGLLDRGVTFASDLVQPVRAPRGGVVAFAGPFKSFGLLLIVEHGHEYHSLLAGMARLDVRVGDVVVAGQAIGSIAGSEAMPARLYLELRHNGRPVNPLPWLAAREDKVRG